ncbi:hypothetical protein GCM10009430_29760 [Aquimarina litoralis]|uniref:Uncharacterized protein n=1 Tax=Aquimarina litoralis TaxID=584605 RepID=A0ABP3U5M0_9FLAO
MNITRVFFFGFALFLMNNLCAQNSVNDYKYVIVPEGYVFLGKNDDYQLNSLTKFLFEKYGFTAFIRGEDLPEDLKTNGCKGLRADVRRNSGLLKTKLIVDLIDCNGIVVFSTKEGTSREKEYKKAYHEALRKAFKDIQALNYKYSGKKDNTIAVSVPQSNTTTEVKSSMATKSALEDMDTPIKEQSNKGEVNQKNDVSTDKTISLMYNDEIYLLNKREFGFELSQKKGESIVSLGKILKSSRKNDYIVNAGDLSGSGYFDAFGNFILDRINPATDKLITDTFARQ